jgi:hypothetical protein
MDVGALITGLSNEGVARALFDFGLPFEAVVFCDQGGEQWVLQRGRAELVRLSLCTLPPERRFFFYDQVHTTGIDIGHSPNAAAALTLGKDSTFRDFAQGAYRMRGIGSGQTIKVMVTPEVAACVRRECIVASHDDQAPQRMPELSLVCTWLLKRQDANDDALSQLLQRQAEEHADRRVAFDLLRNSLDLIGTQVSDSTQLDKAIDIFRDRVDHMVEVGWRVSEPSKKLGARSDSGYTAAEDDSSDSRCEASEGDGNEAEDERRKQPREFNHMFFVEKEQENEEEEEREEELQTEEEQIKQEPVAEIALPSWAALTRDAPAVPWRLDTLGSAPDPHSGPFHPSSMLLLASQGAQNGVAVSFPAALWVSDNFHRRDQGGVASRLRSPCVILEWIPVEASLERQGDVGDGDQLPKDITARLKLSLEILGLNGKGKLETADVQQILISLRLEATLEEAAQAALGIETASSIDSQCLTEIDIARALQQADVFTAPIGRYYILVTLAEAESVRMAHTSS